MFQETFEKVGRDSLHTRFKFSFYVTKDENASRRRHASAVPFQVGRPNLLRELSGLSAYGMHALISASGPKDLRETCHRLAIKCGADYSEEAFQL